MHIDPTRLAKVASSGLERVTPAEVEPTAPSQTAATGGVGQADRLVFSQQASELQAAHETLATMPERSELVARLKAQVSSGTYQVDPENVARKMIPD